MLRAWHHLHKIRRAHASLAELPIAALQALTANINRDPKKSKPFTALDFAMFRERESDDKVLTPEVAATALAMRAEKKDAPILLAAWDKVLASATTGAKTPEIRALHSDDNQIWILCPTWEGKNVRAGLIAVGDHIFGPIRLRDVDRPLTTHILNIPDRRTFAWLETGLLLTAGEI